MSEKLHIATFNLENLDETPSDGRDPALEERIAVMRPQLRRLSADVLCLQEVNSQEEDGDRRLGALEKLMEDTPYAGYERVATKLVGGGGFYRERNLVILSRLKIAEHEQYKHEYTPAPQYREATASPARGEADEVGWERPILRATIELGGGSTLEVVNLHLKSRIPTPVEGQKKDFYTWKTAAGWAEGFFLSSMKRVGQALETRVLIDEIFDADEEALIAVCGDLNADLKEVPVKAIRGDVEETGNADLAGRVMVPCERTIPESTRYTLFHRGQKRMLDHVLASRGLLAHYRGSEVHNEILHDESVAFATDEKYPESDHAPLVAEFELPDRAG